MLAKFSFVKGHHFIAPFVLKIVELKNYYLVL